MGFKNSENDEWHEKTTETKSSYIQFEPWYIYIMSIGYTVPTYLVLNMINIQYYIKIPISLLIGLSSGFIIDNMLDKLKLNK